MDHISQIALATILFEQRRREAEAWRKQSDLIAESEQATDERRESLFAHIKRWLRVEKTQAQAQEESDARHAHAI